MRLVESLGWEHVGTRGSHRVYQKAGHPRNLSIPDHHELRPGVLRSVIATLGLSVDEFLDLLGHE